MELTKVQQGYSRWTGGVWSILEEIGKCRWERGGYLWVGMNVVGMRCDKVVNILNISTIISKWWYIDDQKSESKYLENYPER